MPRFEKRVTDEQVAKARERMDEGATLRAAAAEIPCAPSTLSYRIRRAQEAESVAGPIDALPGAPAGRGLMDAAAARVGPLETLRAALQATKSDGQPHWPTRISAARVLAALRPQDMEEKPADGPEFFVYDLPPGSNPVIHRPLVSREAGAGVAETDSAEGGDAIVESLPGIHVWFVYDPKGDMEGSVMIGGFAPPSREGQAVVKIAYRITADPETADRWRAELAAGRVPPPEDEP